MTTTPITLTMPPLADGEINAGIVMTNSRPSHYLILLPHRPYRRMDWDEGMQWAASISAEMPTPQESPLLYANAGHAFARDWYWTNATRTKPSSYAVCQGFDDCSQHSLPKTYKGLVCAVRRIPIPQVSA